MGVSSYMETKNSVGNSTIHPLETGSLPTSPGVNPSPLVMTFKDVTNSYKHLFFRTLLRLGIRQARQEIGFAEIAVGMMEEAWWPGFHCRLHFGKQDPIVKFIEESVDVTMLRRNPQGITAHLWHAVDPCLKHQLLRYVPQRFLRPWFRDETSGFPDSRVDKLVRQLSHDRFNSARPMFRIGDGDIVFHPAWFDYLQENIAIICGWSDSQWLRFLERRNPSVPGLVEKITPDSARTALTDQRKLWATLIKQQPILSIYTDRPIDADSFDLDHFIPRSFVSHDRFWNLVPCEPDINQNKSDWLPRLEPYVTRLAEQHGAMAQYAVSLTGHNAQTWQKVQDEFAADFRFSEEQLCNIEQLTANYRDIFSGLAGCARRMGFPEDWQPAINLTRTEESPLPSN